MQTDVSADAPGQRSGDRRGAVGTTGLPSDRRRNRVGSCTLASGPRNGLERKEIPVHELLPTAWAAPAAPARGLPTRRRRPAALVAVSLVVWLAAGGRRQADARRGPVVVGALPALLPAVAGPAADAAGAT